MKKLFLILALASFTTAATLPLAAADAPKDAPRKAAPAGRPLRGKVDAVDKTAKTFKINETTYQVTSDTKITKDRKPAVFDDIKVGENVSGYLREGADKKLNVVNVNVITVKAPGPAK